MIESKIPNAWATSFSPLWSRTPSSLTSSWTYTVRESLASSFLPVPLLQLSPSQHRAHTEYDTDNIRVLSGQQVSASLIAQTTLSSSQRKRAAFTALPQSPLYTPLIPKLPHIRGTPFPIRTISHSHPSEPGSFSLPASPRLSRTSILSATGRQGSGKQRRLFPQT